MKQLPLFLSVVVAWVSLAAASVATATLPEVMFILDSSGSMAGKIGGEVKIAAAKQVMRKVVPAIPTEVPVGLTVYGHRRPGDCSDIEMLVNPGQADRQVILEQVERMKPVGKTPLARSLLQVASVIKLKDAETSIILVSDGVDTCGGDPCKVVAQLKKSGIKFVLHTVGLDVDANARQQLECMAKAGGGTYFEAADANALLDALKAVAIEVAGKVEAAKDEVVKASSGLGKLRVAMPQNAEKSLKQFQVLRSKDGAVVKDVAGVQADALHPLLSGDYLLRISFAQPNFGEPTWADLGRVTVTKGETREVVLGSISFDLPQEVADAPWETGLNIETVEVVNAGTDQAVATVHDNNNGYYNFKPKPVVPGIYDVRLVYSGGKPESTVVARGVTVEPGKDVVVPLNTGIRLTGNLEDLAGWDLIPLDQQAVVADEDGGQPSPVPPLLSVRKKQGPGGNRQVVGYTYLIPAGRYALQAAVEGMTELLPVADELTIASGTILEFDPGL